MPDTAQRDHHRHDGPQRVAIGDRLEHPCAECGAVMVLRTSKHGLFYGCRNYPRCRATHGAHPDGCPKGIPGDAETRAARIQAHEVFDRLWKPTPNGSASRPPFTRRQAYAWLADAMCLDVVHIGELDARRCAEVVAIVTKRYGYLFK